MTNLIRVALFLVTCTSATLAQDAAGTTAVTFGMGKSWEELNCHVGYFTGGLDNGKHLWVGGTGPWVFNADSRAAPRHWISWTADNGFRFGGLRH